MKLDVTIRVQCDEDDIESALQSALESIQTHVMESDFGDWELDLETGPIALSVSEDA